ncbi:unnamed protein product [Dovyalis caffra]|uniref:ANK_REP_REGION domain-containing protein n=1 Tax=Dovyalis caffra TaxID=77055 RepID=A0AAV1SUI1_9ROSI|nr:unnamed protein product [Dovyalis caffra]
MDVLFNAGADVEFYVRTKKGHEFRHIHLADRMGCLPILKQVVLYGCQVDSRIETGDTALMLAAKADQADASLSLLVQELIWVSSTIMGRVQCNWQKKAIATGRKVCIFNLVVFSLLHFVAGIENTELLQIILQHSTEDISKHDGFGLTPTMFTIKAGHTEAFRLLIDAGADINERIRDG